MKNIEMVGLGLLTLVGGFGPMIIGMFKWASLSAAIPFTIFCVLGSIAPAVVPVVSKYRSK